MATASTLISKPRIEENSAPGNSISQNFGLLPEPKAPFGSFGVSLIVNLVLGVAFIWIAMLQLHRNPPLPRYESTQLVFPTAPPPPPKLPPVPPVKVTVPPAPLTELPPRIQIPVQPKPLPEPPKPEIAHLNTPMPVIPPAPPKAVVAPPQPKTGLFASAKNTPVANNQAKPTVQTGGFGDPSGATPNPNATRPSSIAAVGSFSAAPGAAQGSGAARQGTVQGTTFGAGVPNGVAGGTGHGAVASAGFSNGVIGGTPGGTGATRGTVATGGFGNNSFGGNAAPVAKPQAVNFVAPEVISEPRPQYTEEARQLKIQGEVTLQVKFGANGKVEVLKVVTGLGHGLDEQAERVAQQIRFKPAARNGQPTDQITLIHILFQLA
jgi:TonB family protein